jgi:aminoglycoside phosphotransferase (APT) family kinase protein
MALATAAALMRRLHDVSVRYVPPPGATWSTEMADPDAAEVPADELVICHNDVCLENLVYRNQVAVGLLDFDFAAPGRRLHDLAVFARMNVPIDTDDDARLLGRAGPFDAPRRLRIVADAYGLPPDRSAFIDALAQGVQRGGQFLQRRLDEGNEAFRAMVETTGGMAKFDRRRAWFAAHRDDLAAALG